PHDGHTVIGFGYAFRFADARPGLVRVRNGKDDASRRLSLLPACAPQFTEFGHAALIAFAPRGHTIAHPIEFHRNFAIESVRLALFLREHLVAPRLIGGKSSVQASRKPAVEPKRGARQILQKTPIMADQDKRRA